MTRPRLGTAAVAMMVAAAIVPTPGSAQAGVIVEGRVYDAAANDAIVNALVTLDGHGAMLSSPEGTFHFQRVAPGAYTLRIEAFGYRDREMSLRVGEDTVVTVPLDADAFELDSLFIDARTLDFDGRVRDPARDYSVMDAQVLSDQGHEEWTNAHGRFDLDNVFEGAQLHLVIRAFGYLPLDTTFVPDDEERYDFLLSPDPLVEAMIESQNRRLVARAGDLMYEFRPSINRDLLARYAGTGTLRSMLEHRYPLSTLRRVACLMLDEVQLATRDEWRFVLENTVPEEVERIELLEFPYQGRPLMLRVYTRAFFQELMATNRELRTPLMHPFTGICK